MQAINKKISYLKLISLFVFISFIAFSCVDEYWPDIDSRYNEVLVVDGVITNDEGPYTIKLSYSSSINDAEFKPFSGCVVKIIDDEGNEEVLVEDIPGIYSTSTNGIRGIVGRSYKIEISTPSGKVYKSNFEKLNAPVEIEEIKTVIEYHADNSYPYELAGYRFYISTETAETDTSYFLWNLTGTYKYRSDYLIKYIYDNRKWSVFPKPDSLYICYHTYKIPGIYTFSTLNLSIPQVKDFQLHFVSTETRKLSIRYSLLVKQLCLTCNAYEYWNEINSVNGGQNWIANEQPYQIRGNIYNVNDTDELVLGYFYAAGISKKRIYVNRPNEIPHRYGVCVLDRADYEAYSGAYWSAPEWWPIYGVESAEGIRAAPDNVCSDCREKGGIILKPEYWID